jgi:hypothetical protein
MHRHAGVLITSALILIGGTAAGIAQQGPGGSMMQRGPMMQPAQPESGQSQQQQAPRAQGTPTPRAGAEDETEGSRAFEPGWRFREGREGRGPGMGPGMMGYGRTGGSAGARPFMMRMIFILMDSNGDGVVSLEEFKAAHERIFKAMDANKDGALTLEEMREFLLGAGRPNPQR